MLEGQVFDIKLKLVQELHPHPIPQRRRTYEQRPLPPFPVELKDFAGDEGFSKTHFVCDNDPSGIADQPQRAGDAVLLKARQRQVLISFGVPFDFIPVELPQDPDENLPGRPRLEHDFEKTGQIVGFGLPPRDR